MGKLGNFHQNHTHTHTQKYFCICQTHYGQAILSNIHKPKKL